MATSQSGVIERDRHADVEKIRAALKKKEKATDIRPVGDARPTAQEVETFAWYASQGMSVKAIAKQSMCSEATVRAALQTYKQQHPEDHTVKATDRRAKLHKALDRVMDETTFRRDGRYN